MQLVPNKFTLTWPLYKHPMQSAFSYEFSHVREKLVLN